tara:strand:+ start:1227 stop:1442 length:216 start_codon:yes stop_codon:yes gene_type:complete
MIYEVWIRIDSETRMMRGCILHSSMERAHEFARTFWEGRAYEIDRDGVTVYVSEKSRAIMNGGQYSLFGAG